MQGQRPTLTTDQLAIRAEGVAGVEKIRDRLNVEGVVAPSGLKFSTGSVHRIIIRLVELNLGTPPRSVSQALSDRWQQEAKERQEAYERTKARAL
jgi:hypothetical protein